MSDKMECPGCGAYTSGVLAKVSQGEPCPYCSLSAGAVMEIHGVRELRGDAELKRRLELALADRDRAIREAARVRSVLSAARRCLAALEPGEGGRG
jgi:hypothetical protein